MQDWLFSSQVLHYLCFSPKQKDVSQQVVQLQLTKVNQQFRMLGKLKQEMCIGPPSSRFFSTLFRMTLSNAYFT